MILDVFYHKLIHIKVHLGGLKAYLVNIGKFLSTFAHIKCLIFGKFTIWSKMFPAHPKCSPAPPAVPAGFFRSDLKRSLFRTSARIIIQVGTCKPSSSNLTAFLRSSHLLVWVLMNRLEAPIPLEPNKLPSLLHRS